MCEKVSPMCPTGIAMRLYGHLIGRGGAIPTGVYTLVSIVGIVIIAIVVFAIEQRCPIAINVEIK